MLHLTQHMDDSLHLICSKPTIPHELSTIVASAPVMRRLRGRLSPVDFCACWIFIVHFAVSMFTFEQYHWLFVGGKNMASTVVDCVNLGGARSDKDPDDFVEGSIVGGDGVAI
jgi:hypothetical protein